MYAFSIFESDPESRSMEWLGRSVLLVHRALIATLNSQEAAGTSFNLLTLRYLGSCFSTRWIEVSSKFPEETWELGRSSSSAWTYASYRAHRSAPWLVCKGDL